MRLAIPIASHRGEYLRRRGGIHEHNRNTRNAIRGQIAALEQIRPQAVAAGATLDVTNIDAAMIELHERLRTLA